MHILLGLQIGEMNALQTVIYASDSDRGRLIPGVIGLFALLAEMLKRFVQLRARFTRNNPYCLGAAALVGKSFNGRAK
ncbi:hypothetical protein D3C78_1540460 [compost metagenome]